MRIPLHLNPLDNSTDANLARIALHQYMFALAGGRGFRVASPKAKPTRIERLGKLSFSS